MAKQQSPSQNKRINTIYCERCGEDYADTYRRCPFCDERPGRRIDDRGMARRSPLQLAVLVVTLVIILAAAFIVLTKVIPLITDSEDPTPDTPPGQEEILPTPDDGPGGTEQPVTPEIPDATDPSIVPANAVVLSKQDITLLPGETTALIATVAPANTTDTVVWSSDRPEVLDVNQEGTLVNKNSTGEKVVVTVTASAGGVTAQCVVRCESSGATSQPSDDPGTGTAVNSQGKITGAGNGLNVRSEPSSSGSKIDSLANGTTVTILEKYANGWLKVSYSGGKTGYVSGDYVSASESTGGQTSNGGSTTPGQTITKKTEAKVVGAGSGLNVRSGPGSSYDVVASIENGNTVVILENSNGWYKIDYGNGKIGYASAQFIQPK